MKSKIIIDGISLLSPLTGIGRYTYEISKQLRDKNDFEISYFYGYFSKELQEPSQKTSVKLLKSLVLKISFIKKLARKILTISSKIFSPTYDLYWQPSFIPNSGIKAKKIVTTVHDFSFILHKEFQPKESSKYFEDCFLKNIYKSDIIITGSNYSKKEILERLGFKDEKVKVIYHGINHDLFKIYDDLELSFELPKKFILSVGSIEPRKNLIGLLSAYNLLSSDIKEEYKLVLAGFKGWQNSEIMSIIEQNRENIIYLGFISDEELAKVYNIASCFVFASFYEGFGLPVLEAMACGTPVVCSSSSSIPEVGGDAVIYCNPNDIEDIKHKIELVLSDEKLQREMIAKGLERAKEFSWEKSASEHIKLFKELL